MDPSPIPSPPTAVKGIPRDAISALGILREVLRIPSKNRQLVLSVILLVLLLHALLFLFEHLLFHPYLYTGQETVPPDLRETKMIGVDGNISRLVDCMLSVAYWFLDAFEVLITTFATAAIYSSEFLTPVDVLKRMGRKWRGPFVTQLYVAVLRRGYWALVGDFSDGLSPVASGTVALLLAALGGLLSLSGYLLYYYLDVAWESSLPAAVIDGGSGSSALGEAAELTTGRRLRGVFVIFFCGVACEAVDLAYDLLFTLIMPEAIRVLLAVGYRSLCELLHMFKAAAFTLFYYECAQSSGEEESQYARLC